MQQVILETYKFLSQRGVIGERFMAVDLTYDKASLFAGDRYDWELLYSPLGTLFACTLSLDLLFCGRYVECKWLGRMCTSWIRSPSTKEQDVPDAVGTWAPHVACLINERNFR